MLQPACRVHERVNVIQCELDHIGVRSRKIVELYEVHGIYATTRIALGRIDLAHPIDAVDLGRDNIRDRRALIATITEVNDEVAKIFCIAAEFANRVFPRSTLSHGGNLDIHRVVTRSLFRGRRCCHCRTRAYVPVRKGNRCHEKER